MRHGCCAVDDPASGMTLGRSVASTTMRCATLIVIWEASDRVCGKRLRPLVPILVEAMERHGHLRLDTDVRDGLLSMSAATIDRALRSIRERAGSKLRRRAPPSAAVRRSIAVRTFEGWDDPPPGFIGPALTLLQLDLVKEPYESGAAEAKDIYSRLEKLMTVAMQALDAT